MNLSIMIITAFAVAGGVLAVLVHTLLRRRSRGRVWTSLGLGLFVGLGSFALYGWLGAPALPGVTHGERLEHLAQGRRALAAGEGVSPQQFDALVADLAARLETNDGKPADWQMLARGYGMLSKPLWVRLTLERGLERFSEDMGLLSDYADSVMTRDDVLAASVLDKILSVDANNQSALWRRGLVAVRLGAPQEAVAYWQRLLSGLAPDAVAARERVTQALAALAQADED